MSKFLIAGAAGVAAMNVTNNATEAYLARVKMVEEINSIKGLTWKAGIPDKFKDIPLESQKSLLGIKEGQLDRIQAKIAAGIIKKYQLPEGFKAASDFDSVTNWPKCAGVIGEIRDQSNCGCCWAFGGASAASDRLCIATDGAVSIPISAYDVCFGASYDGCGGGFLDDTWDYIQSGAVSGGMVDGSGALGGGFCQKYDLPHCHHHGPQRDDPYPAEGEPGCPSQDSPSHHKKCDSDAADAHSDYNQDQYSFDGDIESLGYEDAIQAAISESGPVETAFTVYADFANYVGGVYQKTSSSVLGGHAVRIVGWGVDDGTKYWKVANSWNPYWGEKGYFRILRGVDSCRIESQAMASASDVKWSYPKPSPTPAPATPTPAPATPTPASSGAACSAHSACSALVGDCCPTPSGVTLDCCN